MRSTRPLPEAPYTSGSVEKMITFCGFAFTPFDFLHSTDTRVVKLTENVSFRQGSPNSHQKRQRYTRIALKD